MAKPPTNAQRALVRKVLEIAVRRHLKIRSIEPASVLAVALRGRLEREFTCDVVNRAEYLRDIQTAKRDLIAAFTAAINAVPPRAATPKRHRRALHGVDDGDGNLEEGHVHPDE